MFYILKRLKPLSNTTIFSLCVKQPQLKRLLHKSTPTMVRFLNQDSAIKIDEELFNEYKFSVDQLMELAGLSCATAIAKTYTLSNMCNKKILICCGPGNNGGDGLVCARHLTLFGYKVSLFYPKRTNKELYTNLVHQAISSKVTILDKLPSLQEVDEQCGLIVDALFGFSFKPPVRADFAPLMEILTQTKAPISSIDIPSGWHVEEGKPPGGIDPEMLISLTAPKLCAKFFNGKFHYLGGRFVPPDLAGKYELDLPQYPGTECCVLLK